MPARTPKLAARWCVSKSFFHRRSKTTEATAAFAICEPVAGTSGSSSEMLTPAPTLRSGLRANFSCGRDRRSRLVRTRNPGLQRERVQRGAPPILLEPRPLEAGTEPAGAQLPRFEAQPAAGILLDQIVRVVDGHDGGKTDGAIAHAEVQVAAPALLGVKKDVRSEGLEAQPLWQLRLAGLEHEPDAARLVPRWIRRAIS